MHHAVDMWIPETGVDSRGAVDLRLSQDVKS